jgi:hypothetical protein
MPYSARWEESRPTSSDCGRKELEKELEKERERKPTNHWPQCQEKGFPKGQKTAQKGQ